MRRDFGPETAITSVVRYRGVNSRRGRRRMSCGWKQEVMEANWKMEVGAPGFEGWDAAAFGCQRRRSVWAVSRGG